MPGKGWLWGLAGLTAAVAALRAWILFGTSLVPGTNGGYYLVQARCVLEHGAPGVPDLPFTFYLQAALAWLCHGFAGGALEPSILLGVKLADSFFPALVVVPVALLVFRWCRAAGAPAWIALASAAAAGLNAPILGMVGDFQKNSLGLVWLAGLLYSLYLWIEAPSPRRALGVVVFWGLSGLTHIGVFGASLLFGGLGLLLCRARGRFGWRTFGPLAAAAAGVVVLAAGIVLWKFDPGRIIKLADAMLHPADYLTGSTMGGGPGGGSGGGPGGDFMGGPGGMRWNWLSGSSLAFGAAALAALAVAWWQRRRLDLPQWCVAVACALGVLVLTGPWVQGDKTDRFQLLAMGPAVLAATFALVHCPRPRVRAGLCLALVALMAGSGVARVDGGRRTMITGEGLRELESLAPLIAHPEKTLIAARHGLEWWTAWALHTHIAQPTALRPADWQKFEAVYFLQSQGGEGGQGGPPPGGGKGPGAGLFHWVGWLTKAGPPSGGGRMGPPPNGRDRGGNRGPGPGEKRGPGGFDGPPSGDDWGGSSSGDGPQMAGMAGPHGGPGGPGGGGGPMDDPEIPDGAKTVHEGALFMLARVSTVPEFVSELAAAKK